MDRRRVSCRARLTRNISIRENYIHLMAYACIVKDEKLPIQSTLNYHSHLMGVSLGMPFGELCMFGGVDRRSK